MNNRQYLLTLIILLLAFGFYLWVLNLSLA